MKSKFNEFDSRTFLFLLKLKYTKKTTTCITTVFDEVLWRNSRQEVMQMYLGVGTARGFLFTPQGYYSRTLE